MVAAAVPVAMLADVEPAAVVATEEVDATVDVMAAAVVFTAVVATEPVGAAVAATEVQRISVASNSILVILGET